MGEKKESAQDQNLKRLWDDPTLPFSYTSSEAFYRGLKELKMTNLPRYIKVLKILGEIPSYAMHLRKRTGFPTRHVDYRGMGMGHQFMIDLGQMPPTKSGFKYFLMLIDQFDNYIYTAALKTKTAVEFQEKFETIRKANNLNEIDIIASDAGGENIANKGYFKKHGIMLLLKGNKNKAFEVGIIKSGFYRYVYNIRCLSIYRQKIISESSRIDSTDIYMPNIRMTGLKYCLLLLQISMQLPENHLATESRHHQ